MKWLKRIADKSIPLSSYRHESELWNRCAIGEVREAGLSTVVVDVAPGGLLFSDANPPRDNRLEKLGMDFHNAVRRNRRGQALNIYLAIQRRVARLAGVR